MIKAEFPCCDSDNFFRLEENGRIRLILREGDDDRPILKGQWNEIHKILMLDKGRENFARKSYSLAVDLPLWQNLDIKTLCCKMRNTGRYFCADYATLSMFGYADASDDVDQEYLFLDKEHWTEVDALEDVFTFNEDRRAMELANKS